MALHQCHRILDDAFSTNFPNNAGLFRHHQFFFEGNANVNVNYDDIFPDMAVKNEDIDQVFGTVIFPVYCESTFLMFSSQRLVHSSPLFFVSQDAFGDIQWSDEDAYLSDASGTVPAIDRAPSSITAELSQGVSWEITLADFRFCCLPRIHSIPTDARSLHMRPFLLS